MRLQLDEIELDRCNRCAGIWFDATELDRVLGRKSVDALRTRAEPRRELDERRGRCPRCKGQGQLVRVASVQADFHIDVCPVCGGQWLDGGELDLLRPTGVLPRIRRALGWLLDHE